MTDSPVLRLTLADTDSWFVRGIVLGDVWRRWAAVAWDLAACLAIGVVLFLVLGQWWKPLAVTLIGYYAFSILLLGNTPGVFFFARLATLEHSPGRLLSLAPRLRRALSRLRRKIPFFRHDASRPSPRPVRPRPPTPFPGPSATERRDARGS